MNKFQIHSHKATSQVDFITCSPIGFTLKVIPPGLQPDEYRQDQAIITAHYYARLMDGSPNLDIDLNYDFEVLPHLPVRSVSVNLLNDAVSYYCENILKKQPDSLSHSGLAFYQYEDIELIGNQVAEGDDNLPF